MDWYRRSHGVDDDVVRDVVCARPCESVGFEVKNGIATRADRLVIILVGMAITGLTHQGLWLAIAMVLLAVLGLITVFQRILEARCQMAVGHKTYQL